MTDSLPIPDWPPSFWSWPRADAWPAGMNYMDRETRFREIGRTWRDWSLSTKPANRHLAEQGITDFYHHRGQPIPDIVWADSPGAAVSIVTDRLAMGHKPLPRNVYMPDNEIREFRQPEFFFWAASQLGTAQIDVATNVGRHILNAALPPRGLAQRMSYEAQTAAWLVLDCVAAPGQFEGETLARYGIIMRPENRVAFQRHWQSPLDYSPTLLREPNVDRDAIHALLQIAYSAGPWWLLDDTVVICERPSAIHLDQQQRLHRADGPAVTYRDGWAVHAWHGTRVPAEVIEGPEWTTDQILAEPNVEIRRVAIERIGWDAFLDTSLLRLVGEPVPDPGNPGQIIALYDVPTSMYRSHVRVLLCTNGSFERDGSRRRFGLLVPGRFGNPIDAAAWTFDWTREQYAALEHRR